MDAHAPGPVTVDVAAMRRDYHLATLAEPEVDPDPISQFCRWLEDAVDAGATEPNAMTLATVTPDGRPSARLVLLKDVDARGFAFYTNLESAKGGDLAANPYAALVFHWPVLERQVRVTGPVTRVDDAEADAYFASRPAGNRLTTWASPQSRVLRGRAELEDRVARASAAQGDEPPHRPPWWGGFRVAPDALEFWQGRPDRLHDRLRYTRAAGADDWRIERLAP